MLAAVKKKPSIHLAAEVGHKKLAEMLKEEEFKKGINTPDKFGNTPLHYAVEKGDIVNIDALIKAGADLNIKDAKGKAPLHYAVLKEKNTIANILLASGADPNVKTPEGNTPLHYTLKGDDQITHTLMRSGADPTIKNDKGLAADPNLVLSYTASKNPNINENVKKISESLEKKPKDTPPKKKTLAGRMSSIGKKLGKMVGRKTDGDLAKELRTYSDEHAKGTDKTADIAKMKRWTAPSISSPLPFIKRQMTGKEKGGGGRE